MRPPSAANPQSIAASTPADTRIYAIGDIHGRADLLIETIARIDDDLERRPIEHAVEVYLGDYIDRGPDSKTVIDLLAVRLVENRAVCLRGNHELLMENFLRDPASLRSLAAIGRHAYPCILRRFSAPGGDQTGNRSASALSRRLSACTRIVSAMSPLRFLLRRFPVCSCRCSPGHPDRAAGSPGFALDSSRVPRTRYRTTAWLSFTAIRRCLIPTSGLTESTSTPARGARELSPALLSRARRFWFCEKHLTSALADGSFRHRADGIPPSHFFAFFARLSLAAVTSACCGDAVMLQRLIRVAGLSFLFILSRIRRDHRLAGECLRATSTASSACIGSRKLRAWPK